MSRNINYLLSSLKKRFIGEGFFCPSCGHHESIGVDKKWLVTTLQRCNHCQLLYRAPTTNSEENALFYQKAYTQGFTTDIPSEEQLIEYIKKGFVGTERDYSNLIDVIRKVSHAEGNKLFEFGCSWGYGSWQFCHNNFEVESFEISTTRAEFARNRLGVKVHTCLSEVTGKFDVVFSSHVLEHVPSIKESIDFCFNILKPGGLFVAVTPNGSADFRNKDPVAWHKLWGLVHPNFLDDCFYRYLFSDNPVLLVSNPYPILEIEGWGKSNRKNYIGEELSGDELLVIVKNERL